MSDTRYPDPQMQTEGPSGGSAPPLTLSQLISLADSARLSSALREAVDFIKWLMAKGIVLSGSSSHAQECLDKIEKELRR